MIAKLGGSTAVAELEREAEENERAARVRREAEENARAARVRREAEENARAAAEAQAKAQAEAEAKRHAEAAKAKAESEARAKREAEENARAAAEAQAKAQAEAEAKRHAEAAKAKAESEARAKREAEENARAAAEAQAKAQAEELKLKNDMTQQFLDDLVQQFAQLVGDSSSGSAVSGDSTRAAPQPEKLKRLEWLRQSSQRFMIKEHDVVQEDEAEEVGRGGQAHVEMATYTGQKAVVKWYTVPRKDEAGIEVQALTEAVILHNISLIPAPAPTHLVVRCYGVIEYSPKKAFEVGLVLELAPQGSLEAVLYHDQVPGFASHSGLDAAGWMARRQKYVEERYAGWVRGIAEALAWLHDSLSLTFCDMKAANVLLFEDGHKVKLADFGSCYASRRTNSLQNSVSIATRSNIGWTERYMSPECVHDSFNTRPSADVWSFGLLVHEVLWGCQAWHGQPTQDLAAIFDPPSPPAWKPSPAMRAALEPIVTSCVRLDPEQRPTMSQLLKSLPPQAARSEQNR